MQYNEFNQPIGEPLPAFTAGKMPDVERIDGRFCRLEHLSVAKHSEDLWRVHNSKTNPQNWTYLPPNYGPFAEKTDFLAFLTQQANAQDPYCFAIIDQTTNQAMGSFSLMRIDSSNRVIEVGAVIYSEALKRSKIATEAQFLLAQYVFETLQYRRYEWKCDSLNQPSRKAAERLGFTFEGTFRQAVVYRQRNRDTAWFSILDSEWQSLKARFQAWLAGDNFNADGSQKRSLSEM